MTDPTRPPDGTPDGPRTVEAPGADSDAPGATAIAPSTALAESTGEQVAAGRRFRSLRLGEVAVDTSWTLANEVFVLVTVGASFVLLGRELGPARYGEYVGLFAVVIPFAAAGYAAGLAVLVTTFREGASPQRALTRFLAVNGTVAIAAGAVAVPIAVAVLPGLGLVEIVCVAIVELLIVPGVRVAASAIRSVTGVPASIRLELAASATRFAVLLALVATDALSIRSLSIGWLVVLVVFVAGASTLWLPRHGLHLRAGRARAADLRTTGALAAPIFAGTFQANGDKAVLNAAGLEREAGLYGAAFRVVSLALRPLAALDLAVFHRFLPAGDPAAKNLHVRRARIYALASLALILPIAVVTFLAAPVIELIVGSEFSDSVEMVRWLVLWLPLKAIAGPPLNGLLGLGRLGLRLVIVVAAAAVSAVLYIALIPGRGWEGAVIGTITAEIVLVIAGWTALLLAQRATNRSVAAE